MSADNWTVCPRCRQKSYEAHASRVKAADDAYGKVSKDQYEHLRSKIGTPELTGADAQTLREDYEIGVGPSGVFDAIYTCSCRKCDFAFEYRYQVEVPLTSTAKPRR